MKLVTVVLLSVIGLVLFSVIGVVGTYVSYSNLGNRSEKHLEALWTNEQNVLSAYTLKVAEMAQVPQNMRDDLKMVMEATLSSRYGKDGSQATFQWIKEHNLPLEPTLYTKIQQTIEAGRDEFKVAQTTLIDAKRVYLVNIDNVWGGWWLHFAGYPKVDLNKYKVIVDQSTQQTFDSGVASPIKLR